MNRCERSRAKSGGLWSGNNRRCFRSSLMSGATSRKERTLKTSEVEKARRPSAIVHVDLDGGVDIFKVHGWTYSAANDLIFESGVESFLKLFEERSIRATFFTIADSLKEPRKKELLLEIVRRGHEIASHSVTHPRFADLTSEGKHREIAESREKLERLPGVKIRGFRAPGYEIDRECLNLLARYDYEYDASVFPTKRFARRLELPSSVMMRPFRPLAEAPLWELPLPDHWPSPLPFNPSYSLLLGMNYFRLGLKRQLRRGLPVVLLFHLIDAAAPLPTEMLNGWKSKLFTLSGLSQLKKINLCRQMLDLISRDFCISTTDTLLQECRKQLY